MVTSPPAIVAAVAALVLAGLMLAPPLALASDTGSGAPGASQYTEIIPTSGARGASSSTAAANRAGRPARGAVVGRPVAAAGPGDAQLRVLAPLGAAVTLVVLTGFGFRARARRRLPAV